MAGAELRAGLRATSALLLLVLAQPGRSAHAGDSCDAAWSNASWGAPDGADAGSLLQLPGRQVETPRASLVADDEQTWPAICRWTPEETVPAGTTPLDCWRPVIGCVAKFSFGGKTHYGCMYRDGKATPECSNTAVNKGEWSDCAPVDCAPATTPAAVAAAKATGIDFPLKTSGRFIVDGDGYRVKWQCINWYGAHMKQAVVNGLDLRSAEEIAQQIQDWGFNCVRLNYAVEGYMTNPIVKSSYLSFSSGGSAGRTYLSVFDEVVAALTGKGLMVVLNSHMSDFGWCCSLTDQNGLWFNSRWPEETFLATIWSMSRRYRKNKLVVAHDTRNEARPSDKGVPLWAGGATDATQKGPFYSLKTAQERAAAMVLQATRGKQLVVIEPIFAAFLCTSELRSKPFEVPCIENRLVYSFHEYKFNIKLAKAAEELCKDGLISAVPKLSEWIQTRDQAPPDETYAEYRATRDTLYGHIIKDRTRAVPIFIGEFGEDTQTNWWGNWKRYARENDLDFAYWSLDGYAYPDSAEANGDAAPEHGAAEPYGMFNEDFQTVRHPWKLADVQALQGARLGKLRQP